jgi:hypothetical protein
MYTPSGQKTLPVFHFIVIFVLVVQAPPVNPVFALYDLLHSWKFTFAKDFQPAFSNHQIQAFSNHQIQAFSNQKKM